MWHKPCRTFHPWCPCIKTRCLFYPWCPGVKTRCLWYHADQLLDASISSDDNGGNSSCMSFILALVNSRATSSCWHCRLFPCLSRAACMLPSSDCSDRYAWISRSAGFCRTGSGWPTGPSVSPSAADWTPRGETHIQSKAPWDCWPDTKLLWPLLLRKLTGD